MDQPIRTGEAYGWFVRLTRCHRLGAFESPTSQHVMFRLDSASIRQSDHRHCAFVRLTRCHRLGAFEPTTSLRFRFRLDATSVELYQWKRISR